MRVVTVLVGIFLGGLAVGALLLAWQGVPLEAPRASPRVSAIPSSVPRRVSPFPMAPSGAANVPHVVCTGCDRSPTITVTTAEPARKAAVASQFQHTPDAYVLLGGRIAYPHELVREILERQEVGHVLYSVDMPALGYSIRGTREGAETYGVRPEDVTPAAESAITVAFSVRYPKLSDAQFAFLRDRNDYRFVYGLIAAIVRHEGRHIRALRAYADELAGILGRPLESPVTIRASEVEFRRRAADEIFRRLSERVADAQRRHEAAQDAIDDPAKAARIEFFFEEEVEGEVPPPIVGQFIGESLFSFALPPGPVPRPPVPNVPP